MPGNPWLSMAKDVPVREILELLLRLEVVSGVITVAGTPTKGSGGCSCPVCGFCGGWTCVPFGTVIVCPAHRLAQAKHAPNAPTARAIVQ
jgi:hypothetical protein